MRYRGGGVGHLYMRAIEVWLAETGWGSNDTQEDVDLEESEEDSEDDETSRTDGSSGDEVPEDDAVSNSTTDSDRESIDLDAEYASSENDEETMDGEYGFSSL